MTTNLTSRPAQYRKRVGFGGQVRAKLHGLAYIAVADLPGLIDGWLLDAENGRLTERTRGTRIDIAGKLLWWMQQQRVERLDREAMRRFFAYCGNASGVRWGNEFDSRGRHRPTRSKAISAATVDTYFVYLQSFFNWAVSEGLLQVSPLAKIDRPDTRSIGQIEPFSAKQIGALLEAAAYTPAPERDSAIILTLLDTGARVSEICGATIGHVDKTNKTIRVLGKGRKERVVRFGRETSMALWRYLRTRHDGGDPAAPLFTAAGGNHSGSALSADAVRCVIEKVGRAAGIQGVRCSPHMLRHTFAVMFLRNGGNTFALQQLLGHTDLKMTQRYVRLAASDLTAQHVAASPVDNLRRRK